MTAKLFRFRTFVLPAVAGIAALGTALQGTGQIAGAPATDDPEAVSDLGGGLGPDVIVGDLPATQHWGGVGGIQAYSLATDSCNIGDEVLPWFGETNAHPVIAQNMYRLKDGRLEQLGMSWVKHGFGALALDTCSDDCQDPGTFDVLGVSCSDPYTTGLNGDQGGFGNIAGLGPRSEVNAATGFFPFPYGSQGQTGDEIYKRLQVRTADLDPIQNEGALYFIEGHYVTPDDAAAGNQNNNASYRQVTVGADFELTFAGDTQRQRPGILAWADLDPTVQIAHVDVPGDGRLTLATKVTDEGGSWRYEYALYNMNSHRSVGRFAVPVDVTADVDGIGFRDVDYHSGEPFTNTDWPPTLDLPGGTLAWATDTFDVDPDANALRWGTVYNFWFDADLPPAPADIELGLFRPGAPATILVPSVAPLASIFADGFESGNTSAW